MISDQKKFIEEGKIVNFIQGVEIKRTKDKGRGVFASKSLKKGDLLVVEKAIAEVKIE